MASNRQILSARLSKIAIWFGTYGEIVAGLAKIGIVVLRHLGEAAEEIRDVAGEYFDADRAGVRPERRAINESASADADEPAEVGEE